MCVQFSVHLQFVESTQFGTLEGDALLILYNCVYMQYRTGAVTIILTIVRRPTVYLFSKCLYYKVYQSMSSLFSKFLY